MVLMIACSRRTAIDQGRVLVGARVGRLVAHLAPYLSRKVDFCYSIDMGQQTGALQVAHLLRRVQRVGRNLVARQPRRIASCCMAAWAGVTGFCRARMKCAFEASSVCRITTVRLTIPSPSGRMQFGWVGLSWFKSLSHAPMLIHSKEQSVIMELSNGTRVGKRERNGGWIRQRSDVIAGPWPGKKRGECSGRYRGAKG
jgi:hypothetical protein